MTINPAKRQAEVLTAKRREMGEGGRCSADGGRHLVWVRRPAYVGAHDKSSTTSQHDTASTMSEYWQAPQHGKAEKHNGDKPREAASVLANGEEAVGGGGGRADGAQVGLAA
jgi:hypothetical protein